MADPNVIACLYPFVTNSSLLSNALRTINMAKNEVRRVKPLLEDRSWPSSHDNDNGDSDGGDENGDDDDENGDDDDENSDDDDENSDDDDENGDGDDENSDGEESREASRHVNHNYSPGLQFRFDDERKHRVGVVFGTSSKADVVLPKRDSLSSLAPLQCALTFDNQGRLILRDLQNPGKKNGGTAVTYNDKGGQRRRGFTWVLSSNNFLTSRLPIVIALHPNLKFHIVIPRHDINSLLYQENVARFRHEVAANVDELSLGGLGFQSLGSTAALTEIRAPGKDRILLDDKELGRGAQAMVVRVWDVSTGLEYASKRPLQPRSWELLEREAYLLKQIDHPHIVKLMFSTEGPMPALFLEYVVLGTLEDQNEDRQISTEESFEILRQSLSALRHLHERNDPIVHRDIKPSNILVQSRNPLHIKLSDFGFSKENEDYLRTFCGTQLYAAPEIHARESYGASVDIWSLGVVTFEYAHGLPSLGSWENFEGQTWTQDIVKALKTKAAEQLDISQFRCSTATQHPREDELTATSRHEDRGTQPGPPISQHCSVDETDDGEDQETVIFRDAEITRSPNIPKPSANESSSAPTTTTTYDRSGAPAPKSHLSTHTMKRRTSRLSRSSSSRHAKRHTSMRRQHPPSDEVDYREKWMDALDPLGGGSSLAVELGPDIGSTWASQSSQPSTVRNAESLDEKKGTESQCVFQDETPQANRIAPRESDVPRVRTEPDLGGEVVQGSAVQDRENEEIVEGHLTESERNFAEILRQTVPDTP